MLNLLLYFISFLICLYSVPDQNTHHEILPRTPPPRQHRCRRPPLRHELRSRLWRQSDDVSSRGWSRHGRDLRRPRAARSDRLAVCWLHEGLRRDCRSPYRIDGRLNNIMNWQNYLQQQAEYGSAPRYSKISRYASLYVTGLYFATSMAENGAFFN
jgi:hypothetical protein